MPNRDPRIDAYIARAPEFARPVLEHLRAVVHEACPDVQETIKWGMPSFDHHGIMAGMAAFKAHATFGFWKSSLILDDAGRSAEAAMGQFGRITKLADLPAKRVLVGYVKQAAKLNEQGVKSPARAARKAKPEAKPSADFAAALARNRKARAGFDAASPSCRREYVEWIDEAKRDETRAKRIATAVAQLAEGKALHWKYERPSKAAPAKKAAAVASAAQPAGTRTRSARGRTR
ncbi:MAG TPA: YdeI/OmpD-associated family protein [Xanthomonadales bacterium]|nr:YdeI/OmpD-associated family protein [Xanthomonadales bacterium]